MGFPDDPAAYPLNFVTFADFVRWVWRVRVWTYSWAIGGDLGDWLGGGTFGPRNAMTPVEAPAGEEYRLGARGLCSASGDAYDEGTGLIISTWNLTFLGGHQYVAPAGLVDAYYQPRFAFLWALDPASDLTVWAIGARAGVGYPNVGTATINGYTVPLYADGNAYVVDPALTITASVSVTPYRYFEYRDRNGENPIFDEITGAVMPGMDPLRAVMDWRSADAADFERIAVPDVNHIDANRWLVW